MSRIRAFQMFAAFLLFSSFHPNLSLAAEPAQPPQPRASEQGPKKIIPKQWHRPPAAYEITGGLWRVDHSFEARLQIKNHIQLASVTATPVLFMADGTEYALAPTELEPAGVTSLSPMAGSDSRRQRTPPSDRFHAQYAPKRAGLAWRS